LFAFTVAALAACGGGGSGTSAPPVASASPPAGAGNSESSVRFQVRVPPAQGASTRRPQFVSPGTQSLGIVEQDQVSSSPRAAVYVDVSTCPSVSGVVTCTVDVPAAAGLDTFTVTSYSGTSGSGSVLGTGSIQVQVVFGATPVQSITVNGEVAKVVFAPLGPNLPVGQAAALNASALDASGATIVGTYATPITLTANNLVFSKSTLASSSDASSVTASWSPGFVPTASVTITATSGSVTSTASFAPGPGFAFYTTGTSSNDYEGFKMTTGPDGNLYYTSLGPLTCNSGGLCAATIGAIHRFVPATTTDTEIDLPAGTLCCPFFDPNGTLWVGGGASNNAYYLLNATSNFTSGNVAAIAVPTPPSGTQGVRAFTADTSGNVWFVDTAGRRLWKLPYASPSAANLVAYALPSGPSGTPQIAGASRIAYAAPDGMIYVTDYYNGVIDEFNPSTSVFTNQFIFPEQAAYQFAAEDSVNPYDGYASGTSFYVGLTGGSILPYTNGGLALFDTSAHTFTAYTQPSYVQYEAGAMGVAGSTLFFQDFGSDGLGWLNTSTGAVRTVPFSSNGTLSNYFPDGVSTTSDGNAWFTCYNSAFVPVIPLCVGRTVFADGWDIWPSNTIALFGTGVQAEALIGIMEAPGTDSGPFAATSSDTTICSVANLNDHNFDIVGQSAGACTVTVTDAHNVSATIDVGVTATSGTINARKRTLIPGGRF
jgi:sugar lactone lactonase YvrE